MFLFEVIFMNCARFSINFKNKNSSRKAVFPIWLSVAPLFSGAIFAFKADKEK
jgi:hypothetical protein